MSFFPFLNRERLLKFFSRLIKITLESVTDFLLSGMSYVLAHLVHFLPQTQNQQFHLKDMISFKVEQFSKIIIWVVLFPFLFSGHSQEINVFVCIYPCNIKYLMSSCQYFQVKLRIISFPQLTSRVLHLFPFTLKILHMQGQQNTPNDYSLNPTLNSLKKKKNTPKKPQNEY